MGFRGAGPLEFMEIHKFLIMLVKIKEPLLAMELLPWEILTGQDGTLLLLESSSALSTSDMALNHHKHLSILLHHKISLLKPKTYKNVTNQIQEIHQMNSNQTQTTKTKNPKMIDKR